MRPPRGGVELDVVGLSALVAATAEVESLEVRDAELADLLAGAGLVAPPRSTTEALRHTARLRRSRVTGWEVR